MMQRISLYSGVLLLGLWLSGCTDEVGGDCPDGQTISPVTGECVTQSTTTCGPGEAYSSTVGGCVPVGDDNQPVDTNQNQDPNQNQGPNQEPNQNQDPYDPDCPYHQPDCDDDTPPAPWDPTGDYDPFQPQDPSTAVYHSCETSDVTGLQAPQFVLSNPGKYLLAISPTASVSPLSFTAVTPRAHFIEHADDGYAGFIVSIGPRSGQSSAQDVADWLFEEIDEIPGYAAVREGDGMNYRAHDNYRASILNHASVSTSATPGEVRDQIVSRIYGIGVSDMQYTFSDTATADGSGIHVTYKTVWRSDDEVIIVGGITTTDRKNQHDSAARFALQDLAGGTALALAGETMTDDCVSLELRDVTEVDIIVSLDASGSMSDVQDSLMGFADELVSVLNSSDVDWRVAVTGVDCHNIRDDEALSPEFRDLWPDPDDWEGAGFPIPFPGFDMSDFDTPCRSPGMIGNDDNNGRLMGSGFSTDPGVISNHMGMVSTTGLEYTLTMGLAAIDHSLPRTDNDPMKIRTNAAVVVIVVTDENEQIFKDAFSWIQGENHSLSASQRQELEEFAEPFLGFAQRPDISATIFGLYWMPGDTNCPGGIDVSHGIDYFVEQTGGQGDSICSPNINQSFQDITDASIDVTTGLRLIGNPLASSIRIDVTEEDGSNPVELARSSEDGFDFDTLVNSLFFQGPSTPDIGERLVVPYLRWNRTVIPCTGDTVCQTQDNQAAKCVQGICQ